MEISRVLDQLGDGVGCGAGKATRVWVGERGVEGVIGRNKFVLRRRMFECSTIRQQISG